MTKKDQKIESKVIKSIQKRFNQVKASYQKYHNNPYKAEYIHRFRVDMRKMRALLNFLKPFLNKDIYETFNHSLRELGKKLSPLRDLDTVIEELSMLAEVEPNLVENYAEIFRHLEKERLKLVKSQSTKKAFKEYEGILEGAEAILNGLAFHFDSSHVDNFEENLEKRYQHKINKFEKEYDKLDITNYEAVHEVRKLAKKVRYTSVGFKKVLPKSVRKEMKKRAKKAQERLGEITDTHVIIEILKIYKEKAKNEKVKGSLEEIITYYQEKSSIQ